MPNLRFSQNTIIFLLQELTFNKLSRENLKKNSSLCVCLTAKEKSLSFSLLSHTHSLHCSSRRHSFLLFMQLLLGCTLQLLHSFSCGTVSFFLWCGTSIFFLMWHLLNSHTTVFIPTSRKLVQCTEKLLKIRSKVMLGNFSQRLLQG